jgi:hypothetical protein
MIEIEDPTKDLTEDLTEDPNELLRRLQRNAVRSLVVLTIAVAAVTWSVGAVVGVILAGALVLINFQLMTRIVDSILVQSPATPKLWKLLFLAFRLVLLALVLCGIFLVPGVSPIPVALGLSVLVIAVLIEAIQQVVSG